MNELKNTERELYFFRMRLIFIGIFVLFCFSALISRFVWLQIVKHDDYVLLADENRIDIVPVVPNRGLIMDRNGVILAQNYSAYTLEITPSKIHQDMDFLIDDLAQLVDIQAKHRKRFRKLVEDSKNFESLPIRTRLTDEEVARFTAQRFRFPGVDIQARLFRQYPQGDSASHVIGYIGRISPKDAEIIDDMEDGANYNGTDYIGKEGLEKSYEKILHGNTGFEQVEVSAGGRAVRTLARSPSTSGKNLILSVDIELQKLVEEAFGDRRGALVAIEPATGDVLAFVSKPTYDPNLFVEGIDQQSWTELNTSEDRPLLNRPLSGIYPPGSTYKPYMALAALELGKRTPSQSIADQGFFMFGGHRFNDDKPGGHGMVDMYRSIVASCDTYYYLLANDLGVDAIHDFMKPFGFGQKTGIDLEHEKQGLLPSMAWKRSAYKKPAQQKWYAGETISLGIGQGYNAFTPLQMAHAVATLANNGVVMKPHLVKMTEDPQSHQKLLTVPKESYRIALKQENIDLIKRAMVGVTSEAGGTGYAVFRDAGYLSGGKTGTAQVVGIKKGEKYDAKRTAERQRDNALYIAFAPVDKPRIALALIVENAGFGAAAAAPIARKALDYYLLGKRPSAKDKQMPKTDAPAAPGDVVEPLGNRD
ncbi:MULTISPECIES: penicillin-binding protein 2 [unclassified Undibacterium]|uniref:penicillin-binding protein 2 n=1 Tax=unclassified Undibacterium TaxID=2630295 RepID=UPI002AC982FF|nr:MULTISPECIES: penicillin-binding protein 2 [unclassified Undibacterium]MEB0139938.1 penicillin-binding protein 2 [Undibacterium sp. CCC2.1]MEB0172911.1 penicillin-binding protein 2 [Undibacterium sp. CCC1.1]MEB0176738.1 penicillin-binding protein 2 [Undibacterium sp. CCC3.4]MEB0216665.1 penicillin-binding protein 2 [Undibacterium sp. 5I2]WPX44977.1 penicillin-binding protein 2 [Undibacterium sp. CCC3.4]